jgi:hypothetical protein
VAALNLIGQPFHFRNLVPACPDRGELEKSQAKSCSLHTFTATTNICLPPPFPVTGRPCAPIKMAQIRSTAGYNLGLNNLFAGPGRADATNDPSPLDAIREQTSKIEDWLNTIGEPLKPSVFPLWRMRLSEHQQTMGEQTWMRLTIFRLGTYQPLDVSSLSSLFSKMPYEYSPNGATNSST